MIHLAAFTMPYRDVPDHVLFRCNTMGTYIVHEAAFTLGIRRVVSTSSGAVVTRVAEAKAISVKRLDVL